MTMMVPDEVVMEHEVVKCGMCMVKEMNVVKRANELLRKEVGELRLQMMMALIISVTLCSFVCRYTDPGSRLVNEGPCNIDVWNASLTRKLFLER